ncbi:hypothetical protein Q8G46_25585, partial [Klebsiella pneumoniae]
MYTMGKTARFFHGPEFICFFYHFCGWFRKFFKKLLGNDSNLLIVFYVQIMPDDFVMQLHR